MKTRTRLLALALAAAGALLGAAGLIGGLMWVSACGVVLLAAATAVGIAWHPHSHEDARTCPSAAEASPPAPSSLETVSTAPRESHDSGRQTRHAERTFRVVAPLTPEPQDVVAALAQNAEIAGEILAAHLWLEDSHSATLRLVSAWGPQAPPPVPADIVSSTLGKALSSGSPTLRVEGDESEKNPALVWRYAVPVESGDTRGVAAVDVAGRRPDRRVLEDTTGHLRTALASALAVHVAHQQTATARVLLDAARELSRLVDVDAVTSLLLTRAMEIVGAHTGSVMLTDDDGTLSIAASSGLPAQVVEETKVAAGEGIAGWVVAMGRPFVVEDHAGTTPRSRRHGVRSAVSVPIADEDGVLGVLNVGSRTFTTRFSRSNIEALETLGAVGAVALRSAQAVVSSRDLYFDTLKALALALETKDPYARGTTEKVLSIATGIGERAGLAPHERSALRVAALLHDVGMAAVGEAAAVGDRPLSTVEWGLLKMHPVIAADVISQAPALRDAVPIIYHHHEHYDGGGYVSGLTADEIPIGARILAVADAFVAMTSDRPYRRALSEADAVHELDAGAGTQFDPDVVGLLTDLLGQRDPSMIAE